MLSNRMAVKVLDVQPRTTVKELKELIAKRWEVPNGG